MDYLSEHVNIMGNQTQQIGMLENGNLIIFLYDNNRYISEQVMIQYFPAHQIKPKQEIKIALQTGQTEFMVESIKYFNRQSMEYRVMIKKYDGGEDYGINVFNLYQDILDGNAADIIDISGLAAEDLVSSSASSCKEGAWAFLEYLLSEKAQRRYIGYSFLARKDVFDESIRASDLPAIIPFAYTEEDIQTIYHMVDHMYYNKNDDSSKTNEIMFQEIISFLEDGKSAEETARVIQNRVQLFLDEQ